MYLVAQQTILDRIDLIKGWTGKSARALAKAAGLSPNAINTMKQRKSEEPSPLTLAAIAKAGNVRLEWLVTGEGHPFNLPAGIEPDPDYPTRSWAVALASMGEDNKVPAEVIKRLLSNSPKTDPGMWYWIDLMRSYTAELSVQKSSSKRK